LTVAFGLQTSYDLGRKAARRNDGMNSFGGRVRQLRKTKGLSLRQLAPQVGVGFTYLSKVETGRLDFGEFPSEELIRKLAKALGGDLDELLLLAKKIPEPIRQRVLERPEAFRKLAALDDETLDIVLAEVDHLATEGTERRKPKSR
jgi:transcriptional regulator with XRE-family HTH domain